MVRVVRVSTTVFLAGVPLLLFVDRSARHRGWLPEQIARLEPFEVALYAIGAFTAAVVVHGAWTARRHGLSWDDVVRLIFGGPVGTAFWSRPPIQRLLTPAPTEKPRHERPQTTQEYVEAIGEIAHRLAGPAREPGSEAVAAARQIVGCIQTLDREIAALARNAEPDDVARLEQKLAALGAPVTPEREDVRQMRALLRDQLELVARLAARLEEERARRLRLRDTLKSLWTQLVELRARSLQDSNVSREIGARIRSLRDEVAHHTAVPAATPRGVLSPAQGTPEPAPPP
jgi:hypothetical protein